ncbi:MAG TPA: response regulator, partial [Draconibacterium sp.]|nr:response regulator [Draconibacterium sp.]
HATKELNYSEKTILIAEDEMSNFQLLKVLLNFTRANILWAQNGKKAVELCMKNSNINLVLMDLKMPEMGGMEATKEIKKIFPNLPVIAQTAYTLNGDYQKAREAGCDDYIEKPIQKKKLFNILSNYIK